MILDIAVTLDYAVAGPADLILQIEVPEETHQHVLQADLHLPNQPRARKVAGEAGVGHRHLMRAESNFYCTYRSRVQLERPLVDIASLPAVPQHRLGPDQLRFLMPSRYCQSDLLAGFVATRFGELADGAQIAAIRDWIFETHRYVIGFSTPQTTAIETFVQRQGVCRDFAHVMITLARACGVPARFASVYAPFVSPQDFHAVAEVYLDGAWHLVDATGMAASNQMARIGVGTDAGEVPFLSAFGSMFLSSQSVDVSIVQP